MTENESIYLWPVVTRDFPAYTRRFEGSRVWFYLCTAGVVTIADGVTVTRERAASLPLVRKDGTPATAAEKQADWDAVKSSTGLASAGPAAASKVAKLRLSQEDSDKVTSLKVVEMAKALAMRFPAFASLPAHAQMGVLGLAWGVGDNLPAEFPKFSAALRAGDFVTCAVECTISFKKNRGVIGRNAHNRLHFLQAQRCIDGGYLPTFLDPTPDPPDLTSTRGVKEALRLLRYDCGRVNTPFSAVELDAVKAFQAKAGLVVDGIVGPKTRAALQAALDVLNNPPKSPA